MEFEQPHQELVKCVVVGDTAVGKTRLICARACDSRLDLNQLIQTHVPTVWAIDQYRIHRNVLERSCGVIDGVNVSLRLWDTFGDHDKDRRFAYGRSDVVLLCFSIANPNSLRNCKQIWYPEIRKFCPNTPIVLVGCKNDLRFMYRDERFINICREKSPSYRTNHNCRLSEFGRPLRESDILTPEQGRAVARDLSAHYFETSVFTNYGVDDAFDNIIRVALTWRRQQRFWMTNLKHVQRPLLQEPFLPPKPKSPEVVVLESKFEDNLNDLLSDETFADCVLKLGTKELLCHRVILASASPVLAKMFSPEFMDSSRPALVRSASDSSIASSVETNVLDSNEESSLHRAVSRINSLKRAYKKTAALFSSVVSTQIASPSCISRQANHSPRQSLRRSSSSCQNLAFTARLPLHIVVRHSVLVDSITIDTVNGKQITTVVIKQIVAFGALEACIAFMYTGTLKTGNFLLSELGELGNVLELVELSTAVRDSCMLDTEHCDVAFQLDDGFVRVHRSILTARSEMMAAMFTGRYRESCARIIQFPGISKQTFEQLIFYIYTDTIRSDVSFSNCVKLIEFANQLCLARLVALVEHKIILTFEKSNDADEIISSAIALMEPCQLHNAEQLSAWCLHAVTIRYEDAQNKCLKNLRTLRPENQAFLNRNRWPPVWYSKDKDFYERCARERMWKEKPKSLKRHRFNSGCLCFSTKKRTHRSY
ncbi:Rho-related BTB domain-containing protein 1 [Halotydeus destructor]|nr:Rho-related BTB domain-containing protein 1 [Halotydeus destructor]